MTIHTLPLGYLQTNCYIVANGDRCIAIDPGGNAEKVLHFLEENGLTLEAILLTHGHFDHVGAVEALSKATSCAIWMNESDYSEKDKRMFPLAGADFAEIRFYEDGEELTVVGLPIFIMHTPGHTWGSVCILIENALFAGDTLFSGSIGRTDLAGGNMLLMQKSLLRLKKMDKNYTVYPGHGPKTTLDREKQVNPFLR